MSEHGDSTRVVRAGLPKVRQGEPFLPGPVFAAPFHFSGEPEDSAFVYGRYGNPTWEHYEHALGSLERAQAVLFPSGMAAVAALLLTELRPGSVLAVDSSCYLNVRRFAAAYLEDNEVEVRLAPASELGGSLEGATLLWLESPSNPKLEVYDIAVLAKAAQEQGALTVVDNTTAGPLLQRPLDLGAGAVMTSATKQITGHADLVLGYVTTRDPDRAQRLRDWRRNSGSIPGPFEAWLAHRSLPTLSLRVKRGCANAQAVAALIAGRDDVAAVHYPGLASDPGHEVARTPDAWLRDGRLLRPRLARARQALPGRGRADRRCHELRRRPLHRRAPSALARRRRVRGLRAPVGRDRGHSRPGGGRRAGTRRVLLVTGGSGYLGSELLRRRPDAVGTYFSGRARGVALDIRDAAAVRAAFERLRPAAVIHTAYRQDDRATTLDGAAAVARAAHGVARGCSTSRPTSSSTARASAPTQKTTSRGRSATTDGRRPMPSGRCGPRTPRP